MSGGGTFLGVTVSTSGGPDIGGGWQRDVRVETASHMVRAFACYGIPSGSHIGVWRTRAYGVCGINLRIGRRIIGPCLTLLIHWR